MIRTPLTQRYTRYDLAHIIREMENPEVREEDNQKYKVDSNTLGRLYAYAVSAVVGGNSPGIVLARVPVLKPTSLQDFQKHFQRYTRAFLYERLGSLVLRVTTAAELLEKYSAFQPRSDFAPNTLEQTVSEKAERSQFADIGSRLKEGAEAYHRHILSKRRRTRDNLASEYNAILRAMRSPAEEAQ